MNWSSVPEGKRKTSAVPYVCIVNGSLRIPQCALRLLPEPPEEYHRVELLEAKENGKPVIGLRFRKEDAEGIRLKHAKYPFGAVKMLYCYDRVKLRELFGETDAVATVTTRYRVETDADSPNILIIREKMERRGPNETMD